MSDDANLNVWELKERRAALDGVKAKLAAELRAEVERQERQERAEQVRQARALYGRTGSGGTGPGAVPPMRAVTPEQNQRQWEQQFAEQFNSAPRDRYGFRQGLNPYDVDRYATSRFVDHLQNAIGRAARAGGM